MRGPTMTDTSPTERPGDDRYQVLIARYGSRSTLRSEVFLNHRLYGEPDGPLGMDYFVWIARNRFRTVVIDTGYSARVGSRRGRTTAIDPRELFAALGIEPGSRPSVVVTHAHYDHIGNLAYFADSPIFAATRELDFWESEYARRLQFHHTIEDGELAQLREMRRSGRITEFRSGHIVAPGIEVIEVGGHTPGQSVVIVNTSEGGVLLASDAVHYYEELDRDMPYSAVSGLVDMYAAFDRFHGWIKSGHVAHLVAGHDPSTLERFAPANGALAGVVATIGDLDD